MTTRELSGVESRQCYVAHRSVVQEQRGSVLTETDTINKRQRKNVPLPGNHKHGALDLIHSSPIQRVGAVERGASHHPLVDHAQAGFELLGIRLERVDELLLGVGVDLGDMVVVYFDVAWWWSGLVWYVVVWGGTGGNVGRWGG